MAWRYVNVIVEKITHIFSVLKKELPTVAFKASTQKQRDNIGRSKAATASTAYGADELTAVLGGYR